MVFVAQPLPLQFRQHAPDLRVHIADGRVIAVLQLPRVGVRETDAWLARRSTPPTSPPGPTAYLGAPILRKRIGRERDLWPGHTESKYFLGALNGRCGLMKPTARKKGC
jgi:hypothetical protein